MGDKGNTSIPGRYVIAIDNLGVASSAIVAGAVKWCVDRGRYDVARDLAALADTLTQLEADDALLRGVRNVARATATVAVPLLGSTRDERPRTTDAPWRPPLCAIEVSAGPSGSGNDDLQALRGDGDLCTCPPGACEAQRRAADDEAPTWPNCPCETRNACWHPGGGAFVPDAYICGTCQIRTATPEALRAHRRMAHGAH